MTTPSTPRPPLLPTTRLGRVVLAGAALLLIGLAAGFLPVLRSDGTECGAGFYATQDEGRAKFGSMAASYGITLQPTGCDALRSKARTVAWVGLLGGGVLLGGAWMLGGAARERE